MLGGLVVSQVLTLFITPVVYLGIESVMQWVREKRGSAQVKNCPVRRCSGRKPPNRLFER